MGNVEKILTMVDLCGGPEKHAAYQQVVRRTLPKGIDKDRFLAMEAQVAKQFANTGKVNPASIMPCLHNAVKLGLNPDPAMKQIFFVPYKGELTYQVGYPGMIELCRRSGAIRDIRAYLVYDAHDFKFWEDEKGQHFHYEPSQFAAAGRKDVLGVSIADFVGFSVCHIMDGEHIDKVKAMVLARTPGSPWSNPLFEPEMRKKTVIRRHCKTLPMSPELAQVIDDEERLERGDRQTTRHDELEGILEQVDTAPAPEMVAPAAEQAPHAAPASTRRGRPARQAPPAPETAPAQASSPEPEQAAPAPAAAPATEQSSDGLW